ncbi:gamma-butyrobetaine hydroxylase-like domain-containing protein [Pseudahrensia aquimaris]|uniref:Gamma-butyrobetaine hydroxylase-like domain-containing protein n=1 Tax=Pseudahrensia aquimaris TaxID=744461 RepID=A0ABW3FHZ3_9HYPH
MTVATPSEIRLSADKRTLTVSFGDAERHELSAELLRVESPSAEVQGHDPSAKKTVPGKSSVTIRQIEPVGNYAVRLVFDDGHDTGIYSWSVLHRLAKEGETLFAAYLRALEEKGLSR